MTRRDTATGFVHAGPEHAAREHPERGDRSRRLAGPALVAAWLALAGLLAAPAHALPPDGVTSDAAPAGDPYRYPSASEASPTVPSGWLRAPAAVVDLFVVRPVMATGLAAGAALALVVLPFQAPIGATDETIGALADQAMSTFTRPLGTF